MGVLTVSYKKVKTDKEAYKTIKELLTPKFLSQFHVDPVIKFDEKKKSINAKGDGFELWVNFLEDKVDVDMKLSLMMMVFKKMALSVLEKNLKERL